MLAQCWRRRIGRTTSVGLCDCSVDLCHTARTTRTLCTAASLVLVGRVHRAEWRREERATASVMGGGGSTGGGGTWAPANFLRRRAGLLELLRLRHEHRDVVERAAGGIGIPAVLLDLGSRLRAVAQSSHVCTPRDEVEMWATTRSVHVHRGCLCDCGAGVGAPAAGRPSCSGRRSRARRCR